MNEPLISRIRQCTTLPSLPSIALQVLELAQKDQADIAEIARIISKDPALSSKILKTVNSSFYSRSQSISTISHALVILGLQAVKTLVLGFSLVTQFSKSKAGGFKHMDYWRRTVYAATAARSLAQKFAIVQQEECFLSALLMDIGMLVLDQVLGEEYHAVHANVTIHSDLLAAETRGLGLTHADVAGYLAEKWKLPPLLSQPMALHHRPQEVSDAALRKLAEVTWLAGRCADIYVDPNPASPIADVRRFCLENHGINEPDCNALVDEIGLRTKEVAPLFEVNVGSAASFESILKRANEALVEITLQTQQQAVSLEQQNEKLKVEASTDGLTGLANRATFDRAFAERFAAAMERQRPLSLLMIDLDRFKSVNDRYGHQTGDMVLKMVSKIVSNAARASDVVARYGGEELVVLLPETTRVTAIALAESLRRAVSAKPLNCQNVAISATASIGVATLEHPGPFRTPAHLLKASDLAVYAAKSAGRNCVRVFVLKPPPTKAVA